MVFTTRLAGGRNAFEAELRRLGIRQKNSRPNKPTTCAKVCEDVPQRRTATGLTLAKV
jgi:hypothetical protein